MNLYCVSFSYENVKADERGALNLALKDQLTALEWVQANIETFGGDKKKVSFHTVPSNIARHV